MIHKIRAMHDSGDGASIKQISRFYKLSRNTVRKYLRMDEQAIQAAQEASQRCKTLDTYRMGILAQSEHSFRSKMNTDSGAK